MPQGKYYLAASAPCLKQLLNNHTKASDSPKLTSKMYCQKPPEGKLFEDCTCNAWCYCSPFQNFGKRNLNHFKSDFLEPNGAVIFGIMSQNLRSPCPPVLTNGKPIDRSTNPSGYLGATAYPSIKCHKPEVPHYWQEANFARRESIVNGLEEIGHSSDESRVVLNIHTSDADVPYREREQASINGAAGKEGKRRLARGNTVNIPTRSKV